MERISVYLLLMLIAFYVFIYTECFAERNIIENTSIQTNGNKPEQIHISLDASMNAIYIIWSTPADEDGFVEYGNYLVPPTRVKDEKATLKVSSEKAAKFLHRAKLSNLLPGTRYWYFIVCSISGTKSDNFTFEIPHNDSQRPHKFVVLADMGNRTKYLPFLVHELLNSAYEVVFHIGDIAYNLDDIGGSVGDKFMNKINNFTARIPYMTTPGDHERFHNYHHYRYRFSMPNAPWPMKKNRMWYSIDIGHTHFISIHTELIPPEDVNLQIKWLKDDLIKANNNRRTTPWIIVMGHKPLYCTESVMEQFCHLEKNPLRDLYEDLFFEYGVDLYLSGHKHTYERSWPMYQGRVFQTDYINPAAPIYIVSGTTGYEYLIDKQNSRPFWLASAMIVNYEELFARLTVVNETHLTWSMHVIFSNEEIENIQIVQTHHGSFGKPGPAAFPKVPQPENKRGDLPPEPYFIVDAEIDTTNRKIVLYLTVIILFLTLFVLLRNPHFRRALPIKC